MKIYQKISSIVIAAIFLMFPANLAFSDQSTANLVAEYAYSGKLKAGISTLQKNIANNPKNGEAIFGLGALQFLYAIEGLQQDLHRYGAGNNHAKSKTPTLFTAFMPTVPVPILPNPNPEVASYEKIRAMLKKFVERLKEADTTLVKINELPFKVTIDWAQIKMDLNGNGTPSDYEELLTLLVRQVAGQSIKIPSKGEFKITFDTADAYWLRGYTNLLMSLGNFFLSFDFERSYDASFHAIFGNAATKFGRKLNDVKWDPKDIKVLLARKDALKAKIANADLSPQDKQRLEEIQKENREIWRDKTLTSKEKREKTTKNRDELNKLQALKRKPLILKNELRILKQTIKAHEERDITRTQRWGNIYDLISYYLTIDWAVVEPERLKAVRQNLLTVMRLNKTTWRLVRAETDDDHEWLPNPKQKSPFSTLNVTDETIDSWLKTVAMVEDVLEGRLLVPHPRFVQGINMKRFFEEAKHFNGVLFATGPGAIDFMEPGPLWDQSTFRALSLPMGRNLGAYAFWFN